MAKKRKRRRRRKYETSNRDLMVAGAVALGLALVAHRRFVRPPPLGA